MAVGIVLLMVLEPGVRRLSKFSLLVKGASVLLLGAFIGYVLGFISHSQKEATSKNSWTPVKTDDV